MFGEVVGRNKLMRPTMVRRESGLKNYREGTNVCAIIACLSRCDDTYYQTRCVQCRRLGVGPLLRESDGKRRFFGGRLMDGIHLLGEWYGCPADAPEFTRADALRMLCIKAAAGRPG